MTTMHTLDDFCRQIVDGGLSPAEAIDPDRAAGAFVRPFGISIRPSIDELTRLQQEAGVRSVSEAPLPRGIHWRRSSGVYDIHYLDDQWEGAQEHTVLHETYEIILEPSAPCAATTPHGVGAPALSLALVLHASMPAYGGMDK